MSVRILEGDCRAVLPTLPEGSVQCVVTSPPYWGLRDYGTASWEGGDPACDHLGPPVRTQAGFNARYSGKEFASDKQGDEREPMGQTCRKCGARRIDAQLGLEPTPEAYVAAMVQVFREVRRVLRDDGTLWLNMGDCYNAARDGGHPGGANSFNRREIRPQRSGVNASDLKPKDLVGMPWRLAFALQADGWYLRADIIWAKPNPMPESVTDRPTKAHEYVFLLSKQSRYFYDADAVREPHARLWDESNGGSWAHASRTDETALTKGAGSVHRGNGYPLPNPLGRNLRSVWTISPEPFPDAHFATFPTALAARCIRASSRMGDTVLDPFGGSGTVGEVAEGLGRDSILVELSSTYVAMARQRTAQMGLFSSRPGAAARL